MPKGDEPTREGAPASTSTAPHVFISYLAEPEDHKQWVLDLADRLRGDGIDAWVDQYCESPPEGWPRWVQDQLTRAQFILLICSPRYCASYLQPSVDIISGRTNWEGTLIRQLMFDSPGQLGRFVPVQLEDDRCPIPAPLGGLTSYPLDAGYEALYRRLTGQPEIVVPRVGEIRKLGAVPQIEVRSAGAPEELEARAWLALVLRGLVRLLRRHRVAALSVAAVAIAVSILAVGNWARSSKEGVELGPPTRLITCAQEARRRGRPYVLQSVTSIWHVTDASDRKTRKLSLRNVYVLRALQAFHPKDEKFEEWSGYDNTHFAHWFGPDPFSAKSNEAQRYFVEFGAELGELRTVVTGAEYDYALPREDGRPGCNNTTHLRSNEEALRYPNDQDVICELTIVIESDTTPIRLSGDSALVRGGAPLVRNAAAHTEKTLRQQSLSLHLTETLVPGDDACLKYTWE